MKAKDLLQKSLPELEQELLNLRREQFNLRMHRGSGQTVKNDQIRKARRNIARIKTVQNLKQRVPA